MKQRSENGSSEESQSHKIYGCQRNRARRAPEGKIELWSLSFSCLLRGQFVLQQLCLC